MKHLIITTLAFVLVFSSCKKENNAPAPTNTNPINNSNSLFYGVLTTGTSTNGVSGYTETTISQYANAYFSSSATQYMIPATAVQVGSVYLNNDTLSYMSSIGLYMYIPYTPLNFASATWSVNGANGIPSFTYANTNSYPSFDTATLPDTISKSLGFTVNVNNVSNNFTSATFVVSDGTGLLAGIYTASLQSGNNTVAVTSANLTNFSTSASMNVIEITLQKDIVVNISGKNFKFINQTQQTKEIVIVP